MAFLLIGCGGGDEKSFKLVGINIDEKMKWDEHIALTKKKIASSLFALKKSRNLLNSFNKKLLYSG